jgi:large subunit ribosomal protein L15
MLKANTIKPQRGARKSNRRLGRGQGSGRGGTSGKGHKGDKSRSGRKDKTYFEGGQTPITRRIPKRGFTNIFRKRYQVINVGDLAKLDVGGAEIDAKLLAEHGLIHSASLPLKVLGGGEIDKPITVKADAYSESAKEKLKQAKATVR